MKKMILFLLMVSFFLSGILIAQTPGILWSKTYGNTQSFNQFLDCSVDAQFLYTAGYTNYYPHGDYLIVKYNKINGDTIWKKTVNGNSGDPNNDNDIAMGCTTDGQGNLYVTGMSSNSAANNDFLTLKISTTTGDTIWSRRYNGISNGYDAGTKCVLDANGFLYVSGLSFNGTVTDFCLLKYNSATGALVWAHTYPSPLGNKGEAYSCSVSSSNVFLNGYVITGTTYKLYTIKCNSNGDTLWTRINNEGLDSVQFIHSDCVADNFGNVYITGNCSNSVSGTYGRTIKYGLNGNVIWSKVYEKIQLNTLNDYLGGCTLDLNGNLIVTGSSGSPGQYYNGRCTSILYNSVTGDTLWTSVFNGGRSWQSCSVDASGYLYIVGLPDYWGGMVIKYDNTGQVGIVDNPTRENSVKIYPVPAKDYIYLNYENSSNKKLELNIYNITGSLLLKESLTQNQHQINICNLDNGIYVIEVKTDNGSEKQKLIIQK